MGFSENKKLAKDINNNTDECTQKLETLLASINSQMGLMNSLISSISGGYVSKDYVDMGDAALREELDALLEEFDNKRYVGSDNSIATVDILSNSKTTLSMGEGTKTTAFTAQYSGTVRMTIRYNSSRAATQQSVGDSFYIQVFSNGGWSQPYKAFAYSVSAGNSSISFDFDVVAGTSYQCSLTNSWGTSNTAPTISIQNMYIGADIVMG